MIATIPESFHHSDASAVTLKAIEKTSSGTTLLGRLSLVLLLAYPVSLHISIQFHQLWLGSYLVIGLIALVSLSLLQQRKIYALAVLTGCISLALITTRLGDMQTLIFWPPIIINLILGLYFLRTLMPGQTPLITWFATQLGSVLGSEEKRYTRRVTQVWVGILFLLAIESTLLAIYAPLPLWSLFTNVINYIIVFITFVIEYWVRIRRFPARRHRSLIGFLISLTRIRFKDQKQ